jgi:hypothetical protein
MDGLGNVVIFYDSSVNQKNKNFFDLNYSRHLSMGFQLTSI